MCSLIIVYFDTERGYRRKVQLETINILDRCCVNYDEHVYYVRSFPFQ